MKCLLLILFASVAIADEYEPRMRMSSPVEPISRATNPAFQEYRERRKERRVYALQLRREQSYQPKSVRLTRTSYSVPVNPMMPMGNMIQRGHVVPATDQDAGTELCPTSPLLVTGYQGNVLGWLCVQVERLPDSAWTHAVAFLAGLVTAMAITVSIALLN